MIRKTATLISLFIFMMSLIPQRILAQGSPNPSPVIYQQDSLTKDIQNLRIQYRGELEEYRNLENAYLIAKDQYLKLNTLASLEDAVQKTQAVMIARDKVLHTYLRLVRLSLISQTGIEIDEKQAAEQSLLSALGKIESHQQLFQKSLDKPQLTDISLNYETSLSEVENAAYRALSLISIGKLQTIHDKSTTLKEDMETKIATAGGVLQITKRRRAFDEIDRSLARLKPNFDEIEEKYKNPSSAGYKSIYNTLQKQLAEVHSSLAQILSFLGEVLKI